jgi:DNA-binding beta-propeller fold protein YncE
MHSVIKAWVFICGCAFTASSCTVGSGTESMPEAALYYPLDLSFHAASKTLHVLNTNFDGRYQHGWVSQIDLGKVVASETPETLTLAELYNDAVSVESYGGSLLLDATTNTLFASHRGVDTISLIEVDAATGGLLCRSDEDAAKVCDAAHRYVFSSDDFTFDAPSALSDPFKMRLSASPLDAEKNILLVGHAGTGRLSILDVASEETKGTQLVANRSIYLGGDGNSALAIHPDASAGLFVSLGTQLSTSAGVRGRMYHVDLSKALAQSTDNIIFSHSVNTAVYSRELKSMVFSANGDYAYVTSSSPDALLVFSAEVRVDTYTPKDSAEQLSASWPHFELLFAHALSGQPTGLASWSNGSDDYLAVANFEDSSVTFFSVSGSSVLVAGKITNVGDGLVALHRVDIDSTKLLLALGFDSHTLGIIDVGGDTPAEFKTLAKVGAL